MMLDKFEDISRLALLNSEHLIHSSVFFQYLGEEMVKGLIRDGILRQVDWSQLEGAALRLPLDGVEKIFWISVKDDKLVFEPDDGLSESLEKTLSFEKFVSMDKSSFAKKLFQENGFEFESSEVSNENTFWGTRTISGKKIIWCVSFSENIFLDPVLRDALRRNNAKVCLFTSPFSVVNSTEISNIHVPLPDIKATWRIAPRVYLNKKFDFTAPDFLTTFLPPPLLIDRVEGFAYVYGQKMNNRSGARIFKYIDALVTHAKSSDLTHDYFASKCVETNESPQEYVRSLRSDIKDKVEKLITDGTQRARALNGLYEQPRNGYVKCGFSEEEILIWS